MPRHAQGTRAASLFHIYTTLLSGQMHARQAHTWVLVQENGAKHMSTDADGNIIRIDPSRCLVANVYSCVIRDTGRVVVIAAHNGVAKVLQRPLRASRGNLKFISFL